MRSGPDLRRRAQTPGGRSMGFPALTRGSPHDLACIWHASPDFRSSGSWLHYMAQGDKADSDHCQRWMLEPAACNE